MNDLEKLIVSIIGVIVCCIGLVLCIIPIIVIIMIMVAIAGPFIPIVLVAGVIWFVFFRK